MPVAVVMKMHTHTLLTLALAASLLVPGTTALGEALGHADATLAEARDDVLAAESQVWQTAPGDGASAHGDALDAVDDALACRSAFRVDIDQWVGDVTDERTTEWDALATVTATVVQVLSTAQDAAVPATDLVAGMVTQAPADAVGHGTRDIQVPADVHLTWDEEYVEWERIRESIYLIAPVPGVPYVAETLCDEDAVLLKHVPAPDPGAYEYWSLTPQTDGWTVLSTSATATPMLTEGQAGPTEAWHKAQSIAPGDAVRDGQRALDRLDVVLYEVLTSGGGGDEGDGPEDASEKPSGLDGLDPAGDDASSSELGTHGSGQAIPQAGLTGANLAAFAAIAVAALALTGRYLRRR